MNPPVEKNKKQPRKLEFGSPIPTKFVKEQETFLGRASHDTGLSRSELIRRAVVLLERQKTMCRGYSFILDLAPSSN